MSDNPINAELRRLAEAVCAETASDADLHLLGQLLQGNQDLQKVFLKYCRLHAELSLLFHGRQAHQAVLDRIRLQSAASPVPSVSVFGNFMHGAIGFFSQEVPQACLIATVILGTALAVCSQLYVTHYDQYARTFGTPDITSPHPTPLAPRPSSVARITGMVDVKWGSGVRGQGSGGRGQGSGAENPEILKSRNPESRAPSPESRVPSPRSLVIGDRLTLASGLLQLTYKTGAQVILQGPCTYEINSPAGGFLSLGKLTARVEGSGVRGQGSGKVDSGQWTVDSAKPHTSDIHHSSFSIHHSPNPSPLAPNPSPLFTVTTPTATITDLGTEFGVEVLRQGTTSTFVFIGSVLFSRSGTRTDTDADQQILKAGQSARLDGEKIYVSTVDDAQTSDQKFIRTMPVVKTLHPADVYADQVLSLRPVSYYRMEQPMGENQNLLFDSAPGAHHGVLRFAPGFGSPWERGCYGHTLFFHGPAMSDYALVTQWPKATEERLSVVAWVMALSRPQRAMIVSNWGEYRRGQFHFGLQSEGDLEACVAQRDREHVRAREGTAHPFPLAEWQHVAFVFDKSMLRLYRNGIEVASAPSDGLLAEPEVPILVIGGKAGDDGLPVPESRYFWHGRIDELAIFHAALSPAEIQRLADRRAVSDAKRTIPTFNTHKEGRVSTDKK